MIRVHTGPIATKMVDNKTFGDLTNQEFVGETMGIDILVIADVELPITARRLACSPLPTEITLLDLDPEALQYCH